MLIARLICSDERCAETFEARASTLAELETLACDCDCALAVLGWPDRAPGSAPGAAESLALLAVS